MFHLNSFSSLTLHSRSLQKLGKYWSTGILARLPFFFLNGQTVVLPFSCRRGIQFTLTFKEDIIFSSFCVKTFLKHSPEI
jgi:hypothetical protein